MKHFSNILSLRLIFVKKTWRATIKEVIWRHQARSCILKSFWLWFLRSYVRHHLRDSHGQILSALDKSNIESKSENYGEWWTLFVLVLRCPFTWINRLVMWGHVTKEKRRWWVLQGNDDVLCVIRYSSFIRYSAYCHCFSFFELKMLHRMSELHHRIQVHWDRSIEDMKL